VKFAVTLVNIKSFHLKTIRTVTKNNCSS